jgi:phosphomannomutase
MGQASQYRHLFFDMENTLTPARSPLPPSMQEALEELIAAGRDVVVVSGAEAKQIRFQIGSLPVICLAQNGNHAFDAETGQDMWREELSPDEKAEILAHIASLPRTWPVKDENDLVEDRGSQISYSLLGLHEEHGKKAAFDPNGEKRRALLATHPLKSETVEVKIGGTTTLDYFKRGHHKGHNVDRLIREKEWDKNLCIYIGDALFEGGNDEAVVGVIETHQVANLDETRAFITENVKP